MTDTWTSKTTISRVQTLTPTLKKKFVPGSLYCLGNIRTN